MKCPKCQSKDVDLFVIQREPFKVVTCSSRASSGISFKQIKRFKCKNCNYAWEK